jgi:hypothetical protein
LGRELRVVAVALQVRFGRNIDEATRWCVLNAISGGRLSGQRGGDDGVRLKQRLGPMDERGKIELLEVASAPT